MKKLLLLAAVLAIGTNLVAEGPKYDSGLSYGGNSDTNSNAVGVAGYNAGINLRDILDEAKQDNVVNRFIIRGDGYEDEAEMEVCITVHKPVKIQPEVRKIEGEVVEGDVFEFGDVGFYLEGTKDTKVTFELTGVLFENGVFKLATVDSEILGIGIANVAGTLAANSEFSLPVIPLGWDKMTDRLEMDLYFEFPEGSAQEEAYTGTIMAKAMYE